MWRELLSRGRGDWGLEQAWLLLAAMLPVRLGAQGPPGLAPAARGQRSRAGGTAHQAQALVHVQGPTPPRQLRPQALDLLPQSMVVFLQGLVLLQGEAEGQGGRSAHTRGSARALSTATHHQPLRVPNEGKDTTAMQMRKLGPLATSGQPSTTTTKSPPSTSSRGSDVLAPSLNSPGGGLSQPAVSTHLGAPPAS